MWLPSLYWAFCQQMFCLKMRDQLVALCVPSKWFGCAVRPASGVLVSEACHRMAWAVQLARCGLPDGFWEDGCPRPLCPVRTSVHNWF